MRVIGETRAYIICVVFRNNPQHVKNELPVTFCINLPW
jgi:hypothetical protein